MQNLTPQQRGQLSRKAASLMLRKMFVETLPDGSRHPSKSKKTNTKAKRNKTPTQTLPPRKSLHTKSATTLPPLTQSASSSNHGVGDLDLELDTNSNLDFTGDPRGSRKSTPTTDPLHYRSRTLPRPQSRQLKKKKKNASAEDEATENLRWVVDSRVQLAATAARRSELDSRGTIARRMRDRKMANNTTSIHWTDKIEYTTDMMRSFEGAKKYPNRDPFQDLKKAKQLKQQLQTSNIDLGTGFGGSEDAWTTDNKAWDDRVALAVSKENGGKGRNPNDDKRKAFALKQALQRTTLRLGFGHKINYQSDTQASQR